MKLAPTLLLFSLLTSFSGCKIVYDSERKDVIPAGPEGDVARNQTRLEETYDSQLLPYIDTKALNFTALKSAVTTDLDSAGAAHGNRGAGRGAAWNFSLRDTGKVIDAKLDSSARTLSVDLDDDGAADVTVQLGPVIRGTALRDIAPFFKFDDFRDQIEFAKLARAINEKVKPSLIVPEEGDVVGRTVSFIGVLPLKKANAKYVVTPVSVEFL